MRIGENRLSVLLLGILGLFAMSAIAFIFGLMSAIVSRYQESVFLFGIAFLVLALAVFAYRPYRYPDERPELAEKD
ncbi:MAG: hypothetical protein V3U09_08605 [Thermoplasmata archaeon]